MFKKFFSLAKLLFLFSVFFGSTLISLDNATVKAASGNLVLPNSSFSDTVNGPVIANATFTWTNMSTIAASFKQADGSTYSVNFTSNIGSSGNTFRNNDGNPSYYVETNSCASPNGKPASVDNNAGVITANPYRSAGKASLAIYYNPPNSTNCVEISGVYIQPAQQENATVIYELNGNNINSIEYFSDGNSYKYTLSNIPNIYTRTNGNDSNCETRIVVTGKDTAEIWPLVAGGKPLTSSQASHIGLAGVDSATCALDTNQNAANNYSGSINKDGYFPTRIIGVNLSSATGSGGSSSNGSSSGSSSSCTDTTGTGSCLQPNCEAAVSYFGWMLCPVIGKADSAYQWAKTLIYSLLNIDTNGVRKNDGLFKAWQTTKNLATAIIILIGVIMVGAQVLNVEVFSAYTVKKVLPKLIIATIGMQLSWYIFIALIDIFNAIGVGIYQLLINAFGATDAMGILGANATSNGVADSTTIVKDLIGGIAVGGAAVVGGVALIAAFASGAAEGAFLGLILVMVGALISILVTLVTLIIRKVAIIILLLLSPLALIAWVLPGTQSLWNKWWQNFIKLLGMFPLITLLFAAGAIGSKVVLIGASNGGDLSILRSFDVIIVIIVYFAPLFLIPKTFKFAGTAFAAMAGATAALGDKAKNSKRMTRAKEMVQKNKDASREYNRQQKGLKNLESKNGFNRMRGRYQTGTFGAAGAYRNRASQQLEDAAVASSFEVLDNKWKNDRSTGVREAANMAKGLDSNGNKANFTEAQRVAAVKYLAKQKAYPQLKGVADSMNRENPTLWAKAKSGDNFTALKELSPSLVEDIPNTFNPKKITSDNLSTMDPAALKDMLTAHGPGVIDPRVIKQAKEKNPSMTTEKLALLDQL